MALCCIKQKSQRRYYNIYIYMYIFHIMFFAFFNFVKCSILCVQGVFAFRRGQMFLFLEFGLLQTSVGNLYNLALHYCSHFQITISRFRTSTQGLNVFSKWQWEKNIHKLRSEVPPPCPNLLLAQGVSIPAALAAAWASSSITEPPTLASLPNTENA